MEVVLHTLDKVVAGRPSSLKPPFQKMAEHFGRRGMLVIISDLYEEPDAVLDAIAPLRFRGNDLIVLPRARQVGAGVRLHRRVGVRGHRVRASRCRSCQTRSARNTSRSCAHTSTRLQQRFSANRIDYTVLDTSKPIDHALYRYLSSRARMMKVGR